MNSPRIHWQFIALCSHEATMKQERDEHAAKTKTAPVIHSYGDLSSFILENLSLDSLYEITGCV